MIKQQITAYATQKLGFDAVGVTNAKLSEMEASFYKEWLKKGYQGEMSYLERHWPFKENPELLLPKAASAIVCIKTYRNTEEKKLSYRHKIARYAVGKDYHLVMTEKLKELEKYLQKMSPGAETYIGVDSRPIAERSLALNAGVGFLGKNTMVIRPGLGSYFFIGVILTTLPMDLDAPMAWNCGECQLCLEACPTEAIVAPYELDATKCISYQTIEQKSILSLQDRASHQGWVFGCDICQEVCPYNHGKIPLTNWPEFQPEQGVGFLFLEQKAGPIEKIPKISPLYRARKQLQSFLSQQDSSEMIE